MTRREQIEKAWSDLLDSSREPTRGELIAGVGLALLIGVAIGVTFGLFYCYR